MYIAGVTQKIIPALTTPSPLRERAGVRGNIRLFYWRSLTPGQTDYK